MASAFSFLWESNFFKEVAHGVIRNGATVKDMARNALRPPKPLIPWQRGSILSEVDVKPGIRGLLFSGLACRTQLLKMSDRMPPVDPGECYQLDRENSTRLTWFPCGEPIPARGKERGFRT